MPDPQTDAVIGGVAWGYAAGARDALRYLRQIGQVDLAAGLEVEFQGRIVWLTGGASLESQDIVFWVPLPRPVAWAVSLVVARTGRAAWQVLRDSIVKQFGGDCGDNSGT